MVRVEGEGGREEREEREGVTIELIFLNKIKI